VWNKESAVCDIGYDLLPEFWGKGYMCEALKAALGFAQNHMCVKQVRAWIYYPDNQRSLKLTEKLGFVWLGEEKYELFRGEKYLHRILTLKFTIS